MKNVFTALFEHKEFKENSPWALTKMEFPAGEVVPPHYGDTVEVLFCHDILGTAYIGGKQYDMSRDRLFFIAPFVIHSFDYKPCDGHVKVLKLQISEIKKYLDISAILSELGFKFEDLNAIYPFSDEIESTAKMITEGNNVAARLSAIIKLFENFACATGNENRHAPLATRSGFLGEVIDWSEKNFRNRVTIDEVSEKFGYNKAYFCSLFKASTGVTYLNYLNNLRISHACRLLKNGASVSDACEACGFETTSYFVQLFKKNVGVTPKQYQLRLSANQITS